MNFESYVLNKLRESRALREGNDLSGFAQFKARSTELKNFVKQNNFSNLVGGSVTLSKRGFGYTEDFPKDSDVYVATVTVKFSDEKVYGNSECQVDVAYGAQNRCLLVYSLLGSESDSGARFDYTLDLFELGVSESTAVSLLSKLKSARSVSDLVDAYKIAGAPMFNGTAGLIVLNNGDELISQVQYENARTGESHDVDYKAAKLLLKRSQRLIYQSFRIFDDLVEKMHLTKTASDPFKFKVYLCNNIGEEIKAQMFTVSNYEDAVKAAGALMQNPNLIPDEFARLCKDFSETAKKNLFYYEGSRIIQFEFTWKKSAMDAAFADIQ